ncbi:hypothetical protein [Mycobacterium riyadhense]|uniref:hypothetical protein n=1 Tax=Mycobacterium riyadhense TaxID=486698 RepID=UPI001EF9F7B1|nr:hypothetical protein [Mycobacterium riyadhense]
MGNELANHGASLVALQQSCHDAAQGAHAGWVGSSANALSGLLDRWARISAAHRDRFGEHSYGMRYAAVSFTEMEQRNAMSLR